MIIKLVSYLFIVLFSVSFLVAQSKNKDIERADAFFAVGQYFNAAKHYEFAYRRNATAYILDRLTDCYLKLNEFEKAETIFLKIEKKYPLTENQRIKYANLLKHDGKIHLAKTELLLLINAADSLSKPKYLTYLSSCDSMIKWNEDTSSYIISNLKELNTEFSEISPVHYLDSLVFASNRDSWKMKPKSIYNNQPYFDLYVTHFNLQTKDFKPKIFSKAINSNSHESSATFTKDGKKMYFSQCSEKGYENDSVNRMKLYASENSGLSWIKPHAFIYNDSSYSFAHPCVEKDNKMIFFASDMKGGFGGTDIYVSIQVEDSIWSDPINLGEVINSSGNENYPFYHEDGSLYFASDFHTGMGGYDIFKATQKNGNWIKIENLKPPINSTYDDIGIFFNDDKKVGYFSSNRPGGKGNEDIYLIKKR